MRNIAKKILAQIKNILQSQNIIHGNLVLGRQSSISGSHISGKLTTGAHCVIKGVNVAGNLSIGNNTTFWGPNISLYGNIEIGSFCSIANNVSFFEQTHNYRKLTSYLIFKNLFKEPQEEVVSKGNIIVGSDVWIGSGTTVLSGVTIGHGVVIAANSVVSTNLPPYSICAGSPARAIKYRFSEDIIDKLLSIEWWNWDIEQIVMNKELFRNELTVDSLKSIRFHHAKG